MDGIKPTKPVDGNGRRSFIRKAGAALSAVVASTAAGFSKPATDPSAGLREQVGQLSNRVGIMEDGDAIRRLHQAYEYSLDRGVYEDAVSMFTDDAEVLYNGGLFQGKESIHRLHCRHFASGLTGKKIEPAPGYERNPEQQPDRVAVAGDRRTASGQFPYSIQAGTPITGDSSLVQMARLQGQGILRWWEAGVYEASYVKEGDGWKIQRLEYRMLSKADYAPGRAYARSIDVPAFSKTFPENPTGPDKLV